MIVESSMKTKDNRKITFFLIFIKFIILKDIARLMSNLVYD